MLLTREETVNRLATFVTAFAFVVGVLSEYPATVRPVRALTLGYPPYHVAVIGDSYTNGTDEGGQGPNAWTARAWQTLAHRGVQVTADVAAEGRAGYGARGDHGNVFEDLTAKAVQPDDVLLVFFGSRNDQGVDTDVLAQMVHDTFALAGQIAPTAKMLVIGPAWPTADVPGSVLHIRDILNSHARVASATFIDPIADRWFVGRPDLIGADAVHPNDAGHAYLASKIAPLISAQLPKRI